jgi:hypothetical protein
LIKHIHETLVLKLLEEKVNIVLRVMTNPNCITTGLVTSIYISDSSLRGLVDKIQSAAGYAPPTSSSRLPLGCLSVAYWSPIGRLSVASVLPFGPLLVASPLGCLLVACQSPLSRLLVAYRSPSAGYGKRHQPLPLNRSPFGRVLVACLIAIRSPIDGLSMEFWLPLDFLSSLSFLF